MGLAFKRGEAHVWTIGAAVIIAALVQTDDRTGHLEGVLAEQPLLVGHAGADAKKEQAKSDDKDGTLTEGSPNALEKAHIFIIDKKDDKAICSSGEPPNKKLASKLKKSLVTSSSLENAHKSVVIKRSFGFDDAQEAQRLIALDDELMQVFAGNEDRILRADFGKSIFQLQDGAPMQDQNAVLMRVPLQVAVRAGFQAKIAQVEIIRILFPADHDLAGDARKLIPIFANADIFPLIVVRFARKFMYG